MKKCYVIMPYGGDDPERRKRFEGVYRSLICPAAAAAGYEAIREDHEATPGSITRNIILNLADADMVIADLTGGNANVFYELGIRHVMAKSRTVLICHKDYPIPFDTAAYQVVPYTDDAYSSHEVHQRIVEAIRMREQSEAVPDNSVHDFFPELPVSLKEMLDRDEDAEQKRIRELTIQNGKLKERLRAAGLREEDSLHLTTRELFAKARKGIPYAGKSAMVRLRELAEDGKVDQFVDFLEEAVEAGHLVETEYISISQMCGAMDLPTVRQALLEVALERFPRNERLRMHLVDLYADGYATRGRALELVNEDVGIRVDENGQYIIDPEAARRLSADRLASMYNTYITCGKTEEIITISKQLLDAECPLTVMIYRNMGSAYLNMGRRREAREKYEAMLALDYNNDSNHLAYSRYFDEIGDPVGSYREVEIALALDKEDTNRYFTLAGQMFDYRFVRKGPDSIQAVSRSEIVRAAVPLVFQTIMVSQDQRTLNRAMDFLRRNNCSEYCQLMEEQIRSGTFPDYTGLDAYPLQYCLDLDPRK
ncbi:MAG: tetratricopeptide repeat protein [Oscillospiraceae bacterium]|nr:tetratricopeptide repeat protein [Oscillospiraceae bacterium]